jgi:hypothetical protein
MLRPRSEGRVPFEEPRRLLTEDELQEIRDGVRFGMRGPIVLKWVEQLLGDHDERVRLDNARRVTE